MPIAASPAQAPWKFTSLLCHSSKAHIRIPSQLHLPSTVKLSHTKFADSDSRNRTIKSPASGVKSLSVQQASFAWHCGTSTQSQKLYQPAESWPLLLRHSTHSRERSMHSSTACPAYVGEATASAGEYHCNDFVWEEHRQEVLALLATSQTANSVAATSAKPASTASAEPDHVKGKKHGQPKQHKPFMHSTHDQSMSHCLPSESNPSSCEDQPGADSTSSSHAGSTSDASGAQREMSWDNSHCSSGTSSQDGQANPVSAPLKVNTADMLRGPSSTDTSCASPQEASNSTASQKQADADADGSNVAKHSTWDDSKADHRPVKGSEAGSDVGAERLKAMNTADARKWQYDSSCWESFHAKDNATARFYKERRYLLLEFPCLMVQQPPQHFLEIGCGCGSSLLPVLKANPTCRVTGTDLSPTAVQMFESATRKAGIAQERVVAFAADSTQPEAISASSAAGPGPADAVLLIFTLAALAPAQMPAMLQAALQALKPGGLLLIRDHGLYDLTHLRLRPEQQLSERLYRRLDGTMCFFFTTEDLQARTEAAGFVTRECTYACVKLLNRRTQLQMKRVFVHGVFAKPV